VELWQLRQMQELPLEVKVIKSKQRIKEWYEYWDGQVYVSFSGGKDSTVLLHLVRSMYPDVPAVFIDTGLEYPEIKEFVRSGENIKWLKPKMSFRQVIEKYGYPVVSKEVSETIDQCRKGYKSRFKKIDPAYRGRYSCLKWSFLMDAPFKISNLCCNVMKKNPAKSYEKQTQRKPYLGVMAEDSSLRKSSWLRHGCNAFDSKRPLSQPLAFWDELDIWKYIRTFNVPYSKIYDMGYRNTGCVFCMFGCHLEGQPNRFQRMKITHPQLYQYCMKPWSDGGLGLAEVLDFINVPYGDYIPQLKDYEQIKLC